MPPMQKSGDRANGVPPQYRQDRLGGSPALSAWRKVVEANVVGPFLCCGERLSDTVGGLSDQCSGSGEAASFCDAHVILPDVRAVGTRFPHEVGEVVDDEWNVCGAAERRDQSPQCRNGLLRLCFRAQLENLNASCEHEGGHFHSFLGSYVPEVEDSVELSAADLV